MSAILRYKRLLTLGALAGPAAMLAGCTTFGSNISGDFSCSAPNGSCAPSSTIDDAAIAAIQDHSSNEAMTPAGPYEVDDGDVPGRRVAVLAAPSRASRSVPRPGGRVLRVVFPAYVDRYGQLHEKSAVHAEVNNEQVPQLAVGDDRAEQGPQAGLFGAAESAPQLLAIASPSVPKIGPQEPAQTTNVTLRLPDEATTSSSPLASIKEQVAKRLASSARPKANATFKHSALGAIKSRLAVEGTNPAVPPSGEADPGSAVTAVKGRAANNAAPTIKIEAADFPGKVD
jgi:conjugal transfer pilus assembly protein TraV